MANAVAVTSAARATQATRLILGAYDMAFTDARVRAFRVAGNDNETYGEVTPQFISRYLQKHNMHAGQSLLDLGSGIGQVGFQAYVESGVTARGWEIVQQRHTDALEYRTKVRLLQNNPQLHLNPNKRTYTYGALHPIPNAAAEAARMPLQLGDCLQRADVPDNASFIFTNNFKWDEALNQALASKVLENMIVGAVCTCTKRLVKGTTRDIKAYLTQHRIQERIYTSWPGDVSWTSSTIQIFEYTKLAIVQVLTTQGRILITSGGYGGEPPVEEKPPKRAPRQPKAGRKGGRAARKAAGPYAKPARKGKGGKAKKIEQPRVSKVLDYNPWTSLFKVRFVGSERQEGIWVSQEHVPEKMQREWHSELPAEWASRFQAQRRTD
jgi:hypothetical protein